MGPAVGRHFQAAVLGLLARPWTPAEPLATQSEYLVAVALDGGAAHGSTLWLRGEESSSLLPLLSSPLPLVSSPLVLLSCPLLPLASLSLTGTGTT